MFGNLELISVHLSTSLQIMAKTTKRETEMVRVSTPIKNKVAKKVAGTKVTIGEFYDAAAEKELKLPLTIKKSV